MTATAFASRRLWWALWPVLLGVVAVGELGFVIHHSPPQETYVLDVTVSTASIVTGLLLWRERPDNWIGVLLVASGVLWAIPGIRSFRNPFWFGVGEWLAGLSDVVLAHLLFAYPTGRLSTWPKRLAVAAGYALFATAFVRVLVLDTATCRCAPTRNGFEVWDNLRLHDFLGQLGDKIAVALAVIGIGVIARQWWRATPTGRRTFTPVLAVGLAFAVLILLDRLGPHPNGQVPRVVFFGELAARILIPFAFAFGLLRGRLDQVGVGQLVVRLSHEAGPVPLRDALAAALHDPSVDVAYWVPERDHYVDRDGRPVELPAPDGRRAVTQVEDGGRLLGAIVHDAALLETPGLVRAAAAATRLAMDNERLQAEIKAQLAEVRASRARIVEAGDAERRRVERDLHDGAQQRLLALVLAVNLAKDRLPDDADAALSVALDDAADNARAALRELRDLAQGIHPAILTESGLGAALEQVVEQSPVPASLHIDVGRDRLPATVEATAYFVVTEALVNVAKYAYANLATVTVRSDGRCLTVDVEDDGQGGADRAGGGLRGLEDRVAAADGTFGVHSPPGRGTRVHAAIPIR